MKKIKKGDKVVDHEGWSGTVIEGNDKHNVFVKYDKNTGIGKGLYCIVKTCNHYDPLQLKNEKA